MKDYRNKQKNYVVSKIILSFFIIFAIATVSIVLYDMYINIEVEDETYIPKKVSQEISTENTEDTSTMLENLSKSVVGISKIENNDTSIFSINSEKTLSLGSGIIVSENGYILTNEHVSGARYSKCYVTLENGEEYQGTVMWEDEDIDLSIVKIEKARLNSGSTRKLR